MRFSSTVEPAVFDRFVAAHPLKSHFMQSLAWGEFNREQRGYLPHYTGLLDDSGNLLAAALLLERRPPLFPSYLYAPRGYVIDFFNQPLLAEFTAGIRAFAKERRAMFVALDPDIELWAIDGTGAHLPDGFDNHDLVERMKTLDYRHRGYNTGFEGRQPRFTFRIDLTRDQKEIDRGIRFLKSVKKAKNYCMDVRQGTSEDIGEFHRLITLTGARDEFVCYNQAYYQNFFDILARYGMAKLFIGTVYPRETARGLRSQLAALREARPTLTNRPGQLAESIVTEQRLEREIELFDGYTTAFPDGAVLSAHLVVHYGDKAWAVHAGSDKRMSESFVNKRVYYEKICDAKISGARLFDQFGTIGDPANHPLRSLHEFKREAGGRYTEFVGEFNLVLRPFWYFIYERILPLYRSVRISLKMWIRKSKERTKSVRN